MGEVLYTVPACDAETASTFCLKSENMFELRCKQVSREWLSLLEPEVVVVVRENTC